MKPSLKRKVCSTNEIESCDKEKNSSLTAMQPYFYRFNIVSSSVLVISPFMAIEAIYSFLFYHLSFKTALFDSTWVHILKFFSKKNKCQNSRRLLRIHIHGLLSSHRQKKSRSCFLQRIVSCHFFMKQKSRFVFFMLSRRIYLSLLHFPTIVILYPMKSAVYLLLLFVFRDVTF